MRPMDPRWCRGSQSHHPGLILLGKTEHSWQPRRSTQAISLRKLPSSPRLAVADKLGYIGAPLEVSRIPQEFLMKRGNMDQIREVSKVPEKD